MPRRNRRPRRRRVIQFAPPRDLTYEQMAARLVRRGLASPQILAHPARFTTEGTAQ